MPRSNYDRPRWFMGLDVLLLSAIPYFALEALKSIVRAFALTIDPFYQDQLTTSHIPIQLEFELFLKTHLIVTRSF
ncbi:hypothetical protein [Photobacterium damselae]|uniref:hypothetical protein n=1 Tax=Photobacterium damselae TaxID=38293 RepID=UPI0040686FA5